MKLETPKEWCCYLTRGCDWYDFRTNAWYAGGQEVTVPAALDSIPVFVRAGSVLPLAEGLQYADQPLQKPLTVRVYAGADGAFMLYDDAGDGYDYEQGKYILRELRWTDRDRHLEGAEGFQVEIVG